MPTGHPSWVPDELATAGRENLDPGHASRYDEKEDARAGDEVAWLQARGLTDGATVVDLGAGTGQFTVAVAPVVDRVVAVDVSPVMLEPLRAKLAAQGLTNVEVVQAGFLTYEHAGAPADLVYSRYALHHLPDLWKVVALQRMAGMLRAGGLLRLLDIVFGFDPADAGMGLQAWVDAYPEVAPEGEWNRADIEEHVRDEHSTFTWLLEPMLERAGFTIEDADRAANRVVAGYLCRRTTT
jgi:ubiquinone/menaquinone biosynthesis C-methylase UbiE